MLEQITIQQKITNAPRFCKHNINFQFTINMFCRIFQSNYNTNVKQGSKHCNEGDQWKWVKAVYFSKEVEFD